jgi:hypothetical protein
MALLGNKPGAKPRRDDGLRTCVDCGLDKPLDQYTRIVACLEGWYGRCRACRARREWERNNPGQQYDDYLERKATGQREPSEPALPPGMRTRKDCGQVKLLKTEFTPIKACREGWYGRCHECRNRRARERYHSSPEIRASDSARASKNGKLQRARRRAEAAGLSAGEG